jgi:Transposase, Mutator family
VRNKAIYIALGILPDGKEILGLWIEQTEGAKFWLRLPPPPDRPVMPSGSQKPHPLPQLASRFDFPEDALAADKVVLELSNPELKFRHHGPVRRGRG